MAAEGMQFSWRWNGGTISLNLGVIWEMSVNHVVEGGPHKTKEEELIAELESLRQRLGDLEQMVEGRENEDVPSEPFGDLNRIFREAPIGLCCLDTDLRFVQINDWMAAINGLSIEDHLGRTIGEVLPDVAAGIEAQFRRVLETGEPILEGTVEAETPARPGIRRTFQHNYYPLKSGDGTVVGVSCVVQDITERKHADKALKERYRQLLESTTAMPWEADARTWMFTYVGPQAVELFGYPRELWLEKDFWVDHIHPEDSAWVVDYCLKSSNQHENYEFEYRMIAADGRSVWLHDVVNVMRQDGAPVTLRGFMIDITERKRAEQALGESEERLRAWMDNSDTPITLKDMEGRYLLANERFSVRFNVSRDVRRLWEKRLTIYSRRNMRMKFPPMIARCWKPEPRPNGRPKRPSRTAPHGPPSCTSFRSFGPTAVTRASERLRSTSPNASGRRSYNET